MNPRAAALLVRYRRRERPVTDVPRAVTRLLLLALLLQIGWHALQPPAVARAAQLPAAPPASRLQLIALAEPVALAKGLMLWLQAFDHQPGISIPFARLDYDRVTAWLQVILDLDPMSGYPLLSAARVYSEVPDFDKKRKMIKFIQQRFLERPNQRWVWMAHAVYVAKHRIKDLPLALLLARALRQHTDPERVPGWARQMELFVLEEMGDIESAKVLLGGLVVSGEITDPHELAFLEKRLGEVP